MAATTCVHCGKAARISYFPRYGQWTDPLFGWLSTDLHYWLSQNQGQILKVVSELDSLLRVQEPGGASVKWRIGLCENCRRPLFVVLDEQETEIIRTFPPISLERPPHVPIGVADDYVEATLCLSVGAYKAAAAMCRRALQAGALDKACKRAKLKTQLNELSQKGLLNPSLLKVAHQVRYFGNYGAHPDEDGLGDVTQEEAETIRDLTWQVLEDLYINPARVEAMEKALTDKKAEREAAPEPAAEEAQPPAEESG
jgi:hypothetical protein